MSRPCSPEAACERAFYPETMVRKVVDFHDAIAAFWRGLVLDRVIFPEFKAWQHERYRELVLSSAAREEAGAGYRGVKLLTT
ncbi:hypothetical protein [Pseudomonas kurunegalensis]|uniref:hypothetical protein n=1 Tax=Pseudomonas kurunegalensis TaxID=485880 RepID=UPI00236489DC|nr:hypothetical protein [Pseudomonas kurunegalensis]MDD2133891.1 hypothetical protein [Pseudomonas kurunegalensis]